MAAGRARRVVSDLLGLVAVGLAVLVLAIALVPAGDCGTPLSHDSVDPADAACGVGWAIGGSAMAVGTVLAGLAGFGAWYLRRSRPPSSSR